MKQKLKEAFPITKKDVKPTVASLVAAGALQDREPKHHERWAIKKMGEIARHGFTYERVSESRLQQLGEIYKQVTYWHGTGRYQRHNGKQVDVLTTILENKAINPSLDPFDPKLGLKETISLSLPRLYARAYADMHSDQAAGLNRFVSAQQAANFYVVRPALRHIRQSLSDARQHPGGFRAGVKEIRDSNRARQAAMSQSWKTKITNKPVNTMMAFGVGSDIPGNYPILFGIDKDIPLVDSRATIRETREARAEEPITLEHVTHVEVPRERVEEVAHIFREQALQTPVLAIEDMEQYVARQAIGEILLGNEQLQSSPVKTLQ